MPVVAAVSYTQKGLLGIQVNRLSCAGVPLETGDGDNNVMLISASGDVGAVSWSEVTEGGGLETDGSTFKQVTQPKIQGYEGVLTRASQMLANFFTLTKVYDPAFDGAGNIVGLAGQSNPDCLECGGTCVDGGFSLIVWSCIFDCDGEPILVGGLPAYEVFAAPQILRFAPAAGRTRSNTPSNNRVDLNFTILKNPAWWEWAATATEPGVFFPYQSTAPDVTLDAPGILFTTTDPFPGESCECDDGEYITAATILAGGPQPIAVA